MSSELTCEVVKDYFSIDDKSDSCIKLCEVKWNGREPKGYDIRKYDKEKNQLFKGITIPYDAFRELIYNSIENGLVDLNEVKNRVSNRESKIINDSDFNKLFKNVEKSFRYNRDDDGVLTDKGGNVIISARRESKK